MILVKVEMSHLSGNVQILLEGKATKEVRLHLHGTNIKKNGSLLSCHSL